MFFYLEESLKQTHITEIDEDEYLYISELCRKDSSESPFSSKIWTRPDYHLVVDNVVTFP